MSLKNIVINLFISKISEANVFVLATLLISLAISYRYIIAPFLFMIFNGINDPNTAKASINFILMITLITTVLITALYRMVKNHISDHPKRQAGIVHFVNLCIGIINVFALIAFLHQPQSIGIFIFTYEIIRSTLSLFTLYVLGRVYEDYAPAVALLSNQMEEHQISFSGLCLIVISTVIIYLLFLQFYPPIIAVSFSYFAVSILLSIKPLHKLFYTQETPTNTHPVL